MTRAALPVLVAHAGLVATWNLAARPAVTLIWLALGFGALAWAVRRIERADRPMRSMRSMVTPFLVVAALLRVVALPLSPTLSDDIYRYVWDGRVIGAGENPYLLAPDAAELESLRDDLWQSLPHRQVETVYPPLALSVFSIAAGLPAPVYALKALLAGVDLVTCWLLLLLCRRLAVPRTRALWYLWSPLPVLEIAGMGHVDALGVCAVTATVLLLVSRPPQALAAAATAAAAILAKLVPLIALPAWARASGRPWLFVAAALGLVAAALAPVGLAASGVPPGYVTFGVSWEFNGPLYEPLWRLVDRLEVDELVTSVLDRLKLRSGDHDFWNRFYPFNYPRLLAKLALAAAGGVALVVVWWRRRHPVEQTGLVFAVLILFSSTVYPWYLLWVLPWAALCRQPAWLALSATILVSYWPQFGGGDLMPWAYLAVWAPFFLVSLRYPRWRLAPTD